MVEYSHYTRKVAPYASGPMKACFPLLRHSHGLLHLDGTGMGHRAQPRLYMRNRPKKRGPVMWVLTGPESFPSIDRDNPTHHSHVERHIGRRRSRK